MFDHAIISNFFCFNFFLGNGLFAKQILPAGSFIAEYKGRRLPNSEGEAIIKKSKGPGYIYFIPGSKFW